MSSRLRPKMAWYSSTNSGLGFTKTKSLAAPFLLLESTKHPYQSDSCPELYNYLLLLHGGFVVSSPSGAQV